MSRVEQRGKRYSVRWRGPLASHNPPGFRVERISNLVPSHSGWVGLTRQILGKPQIRWHIHEVRLMTVPRRLTTIGNELKNFGTGDKPLDVRKNNTQRLTVWLRDVDFVVTSSFVLTSACTREDSTIAKYESMMDRRLELGQTHAQPYFGMSECHAEFEQVHLESLPPPADVNDDMGLSYFDTDWDDPDHPEYFAPLRIVHGVVEYPTWDEVKKLGIARRRRSA